MRGRGTLQSNFSKGVLDESMSERIDTEHYYRALRKGQNIVSLPQGGFTRRDGGMMKSRLRRRLLAVPLANTAANPITVTAPSGGTAANLTDQDSATKVLTTSTPAGGGAELVVVQIDLGQARTIAAVDLIDYGVASGSGDNGAAVAYSTDAAAWSDFGAPVDLSTTATSRRVALAPGSSVTARYWRFVARPQAATGAVSIGTLHLWTESAQISEVKQLSFVYSSADTYEMALTDRNVDVFRQGVWKAAIAVEHRSEQVRAVTQAQSLDSLIVWHDQVQPPIIQRQGDDTSWDFRPVTWSNIPNQPATTSSQGNRDSIQRITLTDVADNDLVVLSVEGRVAQPIVKSQDVVALAAAIQAALEALPNVDTGLTVEVIAATPDSLDFAVAFTGSTNAGRYWARLWADVPYNAAARATTTLLQDGRLMGTSVDLFGAGMGWPRCGVFFQARLWVAGLHQFPQTLIASRVALFFDFDQSSGLGAARGISATLDTDQVVTIRHLWAGRHLTAFTDVSEWYVPDRIIDGETAISFVETTTYGILQEAIPAAIDGGVFFVQPSGTVIRDFLWDEGQQDYGASAISLLSTATVGRIVDMAFRSSAERAEGSAVIGAAADGTAFLLIFMRSENVIAFCQETHADGLIRGISVDEGDRAISVFVERTVAGQTDLWLERWTPGNYLDAAVERPVVNRVVSDLAHLEGKSVWAYLDRDPVGPFTVTGGAITLTKDGTTAIVGLDHGLSAKPMPIKEKLGDGTVLRRKKRIHTAEAVVTATGGFAIAANGQPPRAARLNFFGDVLGVPLLDRLYTGPVRFSHLLGSTEDGDCEITQPVPGPFTLKSLMLEVA